MDRSSKAFLIGLFSLLGAIALLALTVYPYSYGPVKSALLVAGLIAFAIFETVLDDTSF